MKLVYAIFIGLILLTASEAQNKPPQETAFDRFLRYAKIDTQSQEDQETVPSTKKQFNLAKLLADELKKLDVRDVRVSEFAIVYGMIPGNLADNSKVPTIGFISHMDTSPAVSGENVNVIIHKNYQGGDIVLPNDKTQIITVEKNPVLKEMIGDDIITADGTTLLGSDDKSGISEIMTMIDTLRQNPNIKHGNIAIAFTPDEEVGGGIEKFDVKGFGAQFAYTVDGEELGSVDNETWSARSATVTFKGKSTHPGSAKGVMINSLYAVADFLARFPKDMLPETTEGRVGFVHPYVGTLDVEASSVKILLRDYEVSGLDAKEAMLKKMVAETQAKFPAVKIEMEVKQNYLNMKEVLKNYQQITDNALEAARRAGLKPKITAARGGTDGSNLTFRGLPCPDLFTGGHNFHGKLEFNSRKGLEKSTETLVNLVQIWAEIRKVDQK
ncbi:MAG: peptidase T [Actinomycetota bacterium]